VANRVIATFCNAVILAAGRAIMACQGQTIALPCGEKNSDSVVPSATPSFLLEDVAILFGLMAENRNSCHEITPRDFVTCAAIQFRIFILSCPILVLTLK
jgi:hypothetical protein